MLQGELDRAVEGMDQYLRGGKGGALLAPENYLQQATGVHISDQTVRNRLHDGGMRA